MAEPAEMKTPSGRLKGKSGEMGDDNDSLIGDADGEGVAITKQTDGMMVPSSFNDMFLFNAAVMGLTNHDWMTLILDQLDAIANNVANPYRLQEECDVLALVLSKYQGACLGFCFRAVLKHVQALCVCRHFRAVGVQSRCPGIFAVLSLY